MDRLTRNTKDLQTILELINRYSVRLVSITEHIDTSTSMGRFVANQIISIAQLELENIFERTTEGIIGSARQGNYVYSGSPYGYTKDIGKLTIHEDEAEVVRTIFSMYIDSGYSIRAISMILSSKKTGYRLWSEETISKMLKNEIYIGTYLVRDEVIEEHSPAIIEADTFARVKERLISRVHLNEYPYLFYGLCFCHLSGEKLEHKSTSKSGGNTIYLYYYSEKFNSRVNEKK